MSQHQQNILDGFIETVGEKVDITIRMHYQNPRWLEEEVNKAAGVFDWYLIFPHFAQDEETRKTVEAITGSGWRVGEEIGLICYNDFPLNEYILGGLTTLTTDFVEMGRVAGEMILSGKLSKEHISCSLIRRNTF